MTGSHGQDLLIASLRAVDDARRRIERRRRRARAAWWWASGLLCVLLLDAIVPLPAGVRLTAAVTLLLAIIPAWWWVRRGRGAGRRQMLRDARIIETHHDLQLNPLVNGLYLGPFRDRSRDGLAATLAHRAHDRGVEAVQRVDRDVTIDRRRWREELACAAVAAATWALTLAIAPGMLGTGLMRLVWPWADRPPFSFTRIELAELPPVWAGDDVRVRATVEGDPVASLELVVQPDDDGPRRRAMTRQDAATFAHTLRSVAEPMRVRAEAGGARSKWVRIEPRPVPARTASHDAAIEEPGASELRARLEQLIAAAEGLTEFGDDVIATEEALTRFAAQVAEAAELAAAMAEQSDVQAADLSTIARTLKDKLRLVMLAEAAAVPGLCEAVAEAQPHDAALLRELLEGAVSGGAPPGVGVASGGSGRTGDAPTPAPWPEIEPAAHGTRDLTYDEAERPTAPDDAAIDAVPPAYRDLVRRYYERLAHDERNRP